MNKSESIKELAKALAKAQLEMEAAAKSSLNPHFKSKFAGLPEIVAVARSLNKHGLAYVQPTRSEAQTVTVETVLMHGESGEWISGELTLRPQQDTPQGIGSAITYGRRYGLCALVGIVADEDDDGNAASARAPIKSNGNGSRPAAQPPPNPAHDQAEKLSIEIKEGLEGGFASADEKLRWKQVNRDRINALPPAYRQAIVAAYEAAPVNP